MAGNKYPVAARAVAKANIDMAKRIRLTSLTRRAVQRLQQILPTSNGFEVEFMSNTPVSECPNPNSMLLNIFIYAFLVKMQMNEGNLGGTLFSS